MTQENASKAEEPGVTRENATQRCWAVYAQFILDDLGRRGETPAGALARIPREWRPWRLAWRRWRLAEFITKWRNAAPWPPALALSWIMFAGDWERIDAFLENGSYMPNGRPELECLASSCVDEPPPNPRAAAELNLAMQLRDGDPKHSKRVIVRGLLRGQGEMVEISPADLATLDWADSPNAVLGAVLDRRGGVFYSNVLVDAASLRRAFPERGEQGPCSGAGCDLKSRIRELAPTVIKDGMRAKERNAAIQKAFEGRDLYPPSNTTIKEALKGTRFISSRPAKRVPS